MRWSRTLLLLLFLGCNDVVEEPNKLNVTVTMLRIERIELYDNFWITPVWMYGRLKSEDTSVEGMVVHCSLLHVLGELLVATVHRIKLH